MHTSKLGEALEAVARALDDLPARGMLIGGIAAIVRGVPRATRDIDVTVSGGHGSLAETLTILGRHGLVPRIPNAAQFAEANQVVLLQHEPSGIEVDLSLAWLSFEEEAIAGAELLDVASVRLPVARPEDLIIYKTVAWRPQDRQDIERLAAMHGSEIDQARVLSVVTELVEALGQPERVEQLKALLGSGE
jgi:hypothetical protein